MGAVDAFPFFSALLDARRDGDGGVGLVAPRNEHNKNVPYTLYTSQFYFSCKVIKNSDVLNGRKSITFLLLLFLKRKMRAYCNRCIVRVLYGRVIIIIF